MILFVLLLRVLPVVFYQWSMYVVDRCCSYFCQQKTVNRRERSLYLSASFCSAAVQSAAYCIIMHTRHSRGYNKLRRQSSHIGRTTTNDRHHRHQDRNSNNTINPISHLSAGLPLSVRCCRLLACPFSDRRRRFCSGTISAFSTYFYEVRGRLFPKI